MQVLKAFLGVLEEKPYKWKSKDGEPIHQKYKAKKNTSRHDPFLKKSKLLTKIRQRPYAKRIHGYKMTINDNKEDLTLKSCHLPQIG